MKELEKNECAGEFCWPIAVEKVYEKLSWFERILGDRTVCKSMTLIVILSRSLFRQHCKQGFWNLGTRFFYCASNSENFDDVFCFCFYNNFFFHSLKYYDSVNFIQNMWRCLFTKYINIRISSIFTREKNNQSFLVK